MKIGVFTALWGNLSFEEALDCAVQHGVQAVEIGAGGYPGSPHCPVDGCWRVRPAATSGWARSRRAG